MSFSFGGSSFGQTTTSTAPTFGFGTSTTTTKPGGFGTGTFSFNTPASTAPTFGLGATTTSGFGFGNLSTTTTSAGSGFGGFGGFGTAPGATTTSAGTPGFGLGFSGFGTPATTTSTGFGFGSSFTNTATTTTPSLFSGFGQTTNTQSTGFGGFGGFGAKPATTTTPQLGFGLGFGGSNTFAQGFGQQQQQQQQQIQTAQHPNEAIFNAVFNCIVYGDERDTTLARWNLLQALWGTGKGYYSQNAPAVEFTMENPLCRFKAIGYSCIPSTDNKEGLVALLFNKKEEEIRPQQTQLITSLNSVLGNKPNLTVTVEGIKPISEAKSHVIIYIQEKTATGSLRRIPASELGNYLVQPMQKQQLTSIGVENVIPQVATDKAQIEEYLENPPAGIDPRLWKQAQLDNPDPEKFIPVPMVGFGELRWRMKCQEQETRLHQAFLDRVAEDIAELQRRHTSTVAKITEYRRKFIELEHRILQVLVKQEISRKIGIALQPEEEALTSQLEALQAQINSPNQFKGKVHELLSQLRTIKEKYSQKQAENYSMDPTVQDEIKQFLLMEQYGMTQLIGTIQNDLANLKIIKDGMLRLIQGH